MVKTSAAIVAALVAALGAAAPGWSKAGAQLRPSILLVNASPHSLAAAGGYVTVRVQVRHATRCTFQGQLVALSSFGSPRTTACVSGRATMRLHVGANRFLSTATIHFRVSARNAKGLVARGTVAVVQASHVAPPPPLPALAIQTTSLPEASVGVGYDTTLAATGGSSPYTWTVTSGALPPGLALSSDGVLTGTPTTAGLWPFSAQVTDSAGHTAAVMLTVNVSAPVSTVLSTNWSGYVLSGGPFTGATGTFNVPTISASPTDTDTAEWVGLDGADPTDATIIQAGVDEHYTAASNTSFAFAWIELYPAPAYELPIPVQPGDQVTVTIGQVSAGTWNVLVKDDTNGVTYSINQAYAGPALSAEWIVEAPFSTITQSIETVGTFSPITFTQVGVNPVAGTLTRWQMVQNGVEVSTPSALSSNGFTVAYGSVTPAAP